MGLTQDVLPLMFDDFGSMSDEKVAEICIA
jgi:hypothetical protein